MSSQLFSNISCFAFNKDRSLVAVCPRTSDVIIFATNGSTDTTDWERKYELSGQHYQMVTGVDWAPRTNRIVTCSEDRNAYVWEYNAKSDRWTPTLVMLKASHAAVCAKWSPNEEKFAVGTASKLVCICMFEEAQNWWVSEQIKKCFESTVVGLAWHPSSLLLACASTDGHCRVCVALKKEVDHRSLEECQTQAPAVFQLVDGKKFGEVVCDINEGSWVYAVDWAPGNDSKEICLVSHDSCLSVASGLASEGISSSVKHAGLPFLSCAWIAPDQIVCGGHDFNPALFVKQGGQWVFKKRLDEKKSAAAAGSGAGVSATRAAFARFQTQASTGQVIAAGTGSAPSSGLDTVHQAPIFDVQSFAAGKVVAGSSEGRINVWEIAV